jgi:3-deoxy-D-manno-octulosonic acid kinase
VVLYVNGDYAGAVNREDLFRLPAVLEGLPGNTSRLAGAATWWQWKPAWHTGAGLVVRKYCHGGVFGALAGTLFLGDGRMLNEFSLSMYARRRGVPTATPVAVRIQKACGPFVRAHYVSERIADTVNLLELLKDAGMGDALGAPERRRLSQAIGAAIAAMHDAGIVHADLNLKNILVRDALGRPEAFVIDFDKAKLAGHLTLEQRMANLMRLDRSIAKWAAARRAVHSADRLRFLRAYLQPYPQWSGQWRHIARRYASRHLRHYAFRQQD